MLNVHTSKSYKKPSSTFLSTVIFISFLINSFHVLKCVNQIILDTECPKSCKSSLPVHYYCFILLLFFFPYDRNISFFLFRSHIRLNIIVLSAVAVVTVCVIAILYRYRLHIKGKYLSCLCVCDRSKMQ